MSDFKLREHVRDQHKRFVRKWMIVCCICQGLTNFVIIGSIITGNFDEAMIKAVGEWSFFIGFVLFPNIVFSLPPLIYLNSAAYRATIPSKIRKNISNIYNIAESEDDDSDWGKEMSRQIDSLPF